MLKIIEQKDLEIANGVINEINGGGEVTRQLSELSPLSLSLIHNSMKELNCNHEHATRMCVNVNGKEYWMTPMDMDAMRLMPESQNDDYYVQIYGWNHAGEESGIYFHVPGQVTCFCNSLTSEFRRKHIGNNSFAPQSPNGFFEFNWKKIDLERSSISLRLVDDCVYGKIYIVCHSDKTITYETEKLPDL